MNNDQGLADIEQALRDQRDVLNEMKREVSAFVSTVEVGDLVDTLDSNNTWKMARVIMKDDKYIEFSYLGWDEKWNEKVLFQPAKIRPFRSETPTDTSSAKGGYRSRESLFVSEFAKVRCCLADSGHLQRGELFEDRNSERQRNDNY